GPHRPRGVQFILQLVFVREAIEARTGRLVSGRNNDQNGEPPLAVIVQLPTTTEDAFAVLPQNADRQRYPDVSNDRLRWRFQALSRGCPERSWPVARPDLWRVGWFQRYERSQIR